MLKVAGRLKRFVLMGCALALSSPVFAIDALFVFTPSGKAAAELKAGVDGEDMAETLMQKVNDTFALDGLGRPFDLVGVYDHPVNITGYSDSIALHWEMRRGNEDWAASIHEKRDIYGADLVFLFFGDDDLTDSYAGQAAYNTGLIAIKAKWALDSYVMEHEIGHDAGLSHNENLQQKSIMSTSKYVGVVYDFLNSEVSALTAALPNMNVRAERDSDSYLYSSDFFSWPTDLDLKYLECDIEGSASAKSTYTSGISQSTSIRFTNELSQPIQIYWLNYQGGRHLMSTLASGATAGYSTYTTHPFLVVANGECLGIVKNTEVGAEYLSVKPRL